MKTAEQLINEMLNELSSTASLLETLNEINKLCEEINIMRKKRIWGSSLYEALKKLRDVAAHGYMLADDD